MRPNPKIVLSWIVAGFGFFLGLLALARFGMAWFPFGDRSQGWWIRWLEPSAIGLFALGFLIPSIIAPRNSRRAGIAFLSFLPVTAFCMAYLDFEPPPLLTAVVLSALFFLPFAAFSFTRKNKKRALLVFSATALFAVLVFARSRWTPVLVPHLAVCSAPFFLFALFWLGTHKLGWPSLLPPQSLTARGRVLKILTICLVVFCLDICLTFALSALGSSLNSGDCMGTALFTQPRSKNHAVFTARVIFAGRSLHELLPGSDFRTMGAPDKNIGDWAIGAVQEKFWGLPSWWPHLVLLTDYVYWKGSTYFIDGSRENGFLTRMLPIVGARVNCGRSRLAQDAIVDLRAIREGPPTSGTRLIGYVRKPEIFSSIFKVPVPYSFQPGARITVAGPLGTKTITTDESGIYQVDGLPAGDYTVELSVPDTQILGREWDHDSPSAKLHLDGNGVVEHSFDLYWNGRIEGHIKDESGKPAQVWVSLEDAEKTGIGNNVNGTLRIDPDGKYRMQRIPPGRYILLVNPYGPSEQSPYDIQYYRSASRSQDAQILELGEGQAIQQINLTLPRLSKKDVQVQVTLPDGRVVPGADIFVAYENTPGYEFPQSVASVKKTDQTGLALVSLYGNSRVRILAELSVANTGKNGDTVYYSYVVESEASKMQNKIDLVLNSMKSMKP
jgi:hypothetical protein